MRLRINDPGHVGLRRAIRTTVGVTIAMIVGLSLLKGTPGVVLAAFGTFALLGFADFGGPMARRLVALLLTGAAGFGLIGIGVLAAESTWSIVVVTFIVTGAIAYAVVLRGAFANAAPALTVVYVVTVMVSTSPTQLTPMLYGYAIAVLVSIPITLFLLPRRTLAQVRTACAGALRTLADTERRRLNGQPPDAHRLDEAITSLQGSYQGNPFRSTGVRRSDRALIILVGQLETLLVATRSHVTRKTPMSDLPDSAALVTEVADCLEEQARALEVKGGATSGAALVRRWVGQWDAAVESVMSSTATDREHRLRSVAHAFPDRAMTIATIRLSVLVRRVVGLPDEDFKSDGHTIPDPPDFVPWRALRTQFTLRSPWLRTALRTGAALSIAAAIVEIVGLSHGFWVLLGVIATLRQDGLGTLKTSLLAVVGTFAGALVGALILLLSLTDEPLIAGLFVIAAFVAVYGQSVFPFALAQAVFSLYVVLTFSLVAWPPDISAAADRVLDIAVGAAVSLATAFLLWPRGIATGLARNVYDAIDLACHLLNDAVRQWLNGGPQTDEADIYPVRIAMARSAEVVEVLLASHRQRDLERAELWSALLDELRTLVVTGQLVAAWAADRPPMHERTPALVAPLKDDETAASGEWHEVLRILTRGGADDATSYSPFVPRALDHLEPHDVTDRLVADNVVGAIWAHGWLGLTFDAAVAARKPAALLV